jgi:DinB superfamily
MKRPKAEEFPLFYKGYVDTVSDDVLNELEQQMESFSALLRSVPKEKASFAYVEGKWTILELAGHVIDTERIMAYRALRITRNDATPLPGFDENDYVLNAHFADRSLESLADEFAALRKANMYLIRSLSDIEIDRSGISNEKPISVRALIFIMAGHVNHHIAILKQRYL